MELPCNHLKPCQLHDLEPKITISSIEETPPMKEEWAEKIITEWNQFVAPMMGQDKEIPLSPKGVSDWWIKKLVSAHAQGKRDGHDEGVEKAVETICNDVDWAEWGKDTETDEQDEIQEDTTSMEKENTICMNGLRMVEQSAFNTALEASKSALSKALKSFEEGV